MLLPRDRSLYHFSKLAITRFYHPRVESECMIVSWYLQGLSSRFIIFIANRYINIIIHFMKYLLFFFLFFPFFFFFFFFLIEEHLYPQPDFEVQFERALLLLLFLFFFIPKQFAKPIVLLCFKKRISCQQSLSRLGKTQLFPYIPYIHTHTAYGNRNETKTIDHILFECRFEWFIIMKAIYCLYISIT